MMRWMRLAVIAFVTLFAGAAEAIYTPNPAGRWAANRFFLAGDFQFNAEKDLDEPRAEIEDVAGFYVRPAYSLARNVMIYGRVGFQDADGLDAGFAGGFGVQGAYILPRAPEWAIGGSFDFLYWTTETDRFEQDVDWTEFQFAPAVSYNIPQVPAITPYAGFMLDFITGDAEQDDPFGLLFGSNFDIAPSVRFDAQFRVISETGFFASAGYMF
ncbi:MAG: hypothetical protein ACREQ9_24435 [Candidatus Binatia bacterium]